MTTLLRSKSNNIIASKFGWEIYLTKMKVRCLKVDDRLLVLCADERHYFVKIVHFDEAHDDIHLHFLFWKDKFDYIGKASKLYLSENNERLTVGMNLSINRYVCNEKKRDRDQLSLGNDDAKSLKVVRTRYDDNFFKKPRLSLKRTVHRGKNAILDGNQLIPTADSSSSCLSVITKSIPPQNHQIQFKHQLLNIPPLQIKEVHVAEKDSTHFHDEVSRDSLHSAITPDRLGVSIELSSKTSQISSTLSTFGLDLHINFADGDRILHINFETDVVDNDRSRSDAMEYVHQYQIGILPIGELCKYLVGVLRDKRSSLYRKLQWIVDVTQIQIGKVQPKVSKYNLPFSSSSGSTINDSVVECLLPPRPTCTFQDLNIFQKFSQIRKVLSSKKKLQSRFMHSMLPLGGQLPKVPSSNMCQQINKLHSLCLLKNEVESMLHTVINDLQNITSDGTL
jgi:hypothetical protein